MQVEINHWLKFTSEPNSHDLFDVQLSQPKSNPYEKGKCTRVKVESLEGV